MRPIATAFVALLAGLSGLWLAADPVWAAPADFWAWRTALINHSGLIAIAAMALALMLAARPVIVEPWFGGLDKMYRLHKWLGITALVMAIAHWTWTKAPKWAVGWGWLEARVRGPRSVPDSAILQWFQSHRDLAEGLGSAAFYISCVLIVAALVKWIPYRWFFKLHRLLAVTFLVLVFHAVVLMNAAYWGEAIAPVMLLLYAGGSVAALAVLFGRVGLGRQALGVVEDVSRFPGLGVFEFALQLRGRWAGHAAGQFAFLTFDRHEGAHPFTISSAWQGDGRMRFVIKELGDFTRLLAHTVKAGDLVTVEGPYGAFNFDGPKPRQIWVGGGIGITPFIARMKRLAHQSDGKVIDLFHTTTEVDEGALRKLHRDARAAHVRLHVLIDARDGRLNAERICAAVPQWQSGDVWFCGPSGFGKALRRDFGALGLPSRDFHQEMFDLR